MRLGGAAVAVVVAALTVALPALAAVSPAVRRGAAQYVRLAQAVLLADPAARTAFRSAPVELSRRLARCPALVAAQPRRTSKADFRATFELLLAERPLVSAHVRYARAVDRLGATAPVLVRWRRAIDVSAAAYALLPRLDVDPCHALDAWRRSGWKPAFPVRWVSRQLAAGGVGVAALRRSTITLLTATRLLVAWNVPRAGLPSLDAAVFAGI